MTGPSCAGSAPAASRPQGQPPSGIREQDSGHDQVLDPGAVVYLGGDLPGVLADPGRLTGPVGSLRQRAAVAEPGQRAVDQVRPQRRALLLAQAKT